MKLYVDITNPDGLSVVGGRKRLRCHATKNGSFTNSEPINFTPHSLPEPHKGTHLSIWSAKHGGFLMYGPTTLTAEEELRPHKDTACVLAGNIIINIDP